MKVPHLRRDWYRKLDQSRDSNISEYHWLSARLDSLLQWRKLDPKYKYL